MAACSEDANPAFKPLIDMTFSRDIIRMALHRVREESGGSRYSTGRRLPAPPLRKWLGDTPFVVIGGLATRLYMTERMTLDADILVRPRDEKRVIERLAGVGARQQGPLRPGGTSWNLPDRTILDVLVLERPWVEEAVENPVLDGHDNLPVIALPFLVLLKLESSRTQDLADIARMMGQADQETINQVRGTVRRYRPQDIEDLDSLIKLGTLESGKKEIP